MRYREVEVGKFYLYDVNNRSKQMEHGIGIVKVDEVPKAVPFMPTPFIKCHTVHMVTGEEEPDIKVELKSTMLTPIDPDVRKNVLIRYPADLPVFSQTDIIAIRDVLHILENALGNKSETSMAIAKVNALKAKIEFYESLSNSINNGLPHEVGD